MQASSGGLGLGLGAADGSAKGPACAEKRAAGISDPLEKRALHERISVTETRRNAASRDKDTGLATTRELVVEYRVVLSMASKMGLTGCTAAELQEDRRVPEFVARDEGEAGTLIATWHRYADFVSY